MRESEVSNKPLVYIEPVVFSKIYNWTFLCDKEISGLGLVKIHDGGSLHVYDLFLLKQECSGSDTELDGEEVNKLVGELSNRDEEENLRFWWHSHASMDVFWSGQDTKTMELLKNNNFLLSLVTSRKENKLNTLFNLAVFYPLEISLNYLDYLIGSPEIREFCQQEMEEKVQEKTVPVKQWTPWGHGKEKGRLPFQGFLHDYSEAIEHTEATLQESVIESPNEVELGDSFAVDIISEIEKIIYDRIYDSPKTIEKPLIKMNKYLNNLGLSESQINRLGCEEIITKLKLIRNNIKNKNIFESGIAEKTESYLDIIIYNESKQKNLYDLRDQTIDLVVLFTGALEEIKEAKKEYDPPKIIKKPKGNPK